MNPAIIFSIVGVAISAVGIVLSRTVTRRVRVRVHRASFVGSPGPESYFINVTNMSLNREVEITHVWFECSPEVHVLRRERPLPKRLKVDEAWETWIGVSELPVGLGDDAYKLARVRLSTGKVFRSKRNDQVPIIGRVPGGDAPQAPIGPIHDTKTLPSSITAGRAIEMLRAQIAEPVEGFPHNDPGVYEWKMITHRILTEAFGPHNRNANHFIATVTCSGLSDEEYQARHVEWVREKKGMLRAFIKELQMFHQPSQSSSEAIPITIPVPEQTSKPSTTNTWQSRSRTRSRN